MVEDHNDDPQISIEGGLDYCRHGAYVGNHTRCEDCARAAEANAIRLAREAREAEEEAALAESSPRATLPRRRKPVRRS